MLNSVVTAVVVEGVHPGVLVVQGELLEVHFLGLLALMVVMVL